MIENKDSSTVALLLTFVVATVEVPHHMPHITSVCSMQIARTIQFGCYGYSNKVSQALTHQSFSPRRVFYY